MIFRSFLNLGRVFTYESLSLIKRCNSITYFNKMDNLYKVKLTERLCGLVRPTHYKLLLNPDLKTGLFKGSVSIDINVKETRTFLTLHTKFLNINDLKVFRNNNEVSVAKYREIESLEQLLVQFDTDLKPGTYQLHIEFDGNLTRNIVGFYLSHLKDKRFCSHFI